MRQSMLGWRAEEFFVAVRQHLDTLGPRGLEELRFNLAKAAANVISVFERLNNEHLGRILENIQHMTAAIAKDFQQLDISLFHEASKAVQHTSNIAAQELTKLHINGLQNILKAFQQIADNIVLVTQTLPKTVDTFKHVLLFTVMVVTLATWTIIRSLRNLDKHTDKISIKVQALSTELTTHENLSYQRQFAEAVYNLMMLKVTEQYMYPDEHPVKVSPIESQYVLFHPSSDWHASFFAHGTSVWSDQFWDEGKEGRIFNRVRLFNNPEKLATYLHDFENPQLTGKRQVLPLTYILLPSTHSYTLPFTLRIPKQLQAVKVVGQTDRSGKPYCRACIIGVDPSDAVDVDLLAEHEAPDYMSQGSAPEKRVYPILWLLIAAL
ncbi:unnamed protein product [Aureobasidium vineae]|uniref:Uncharacterized protein n=1 Tax=Aureobasidium vineae TaxID=2773715 RepID=A0A9N8JJS4_9PEZI|nr:unnamed protein product [Aureobasidium vineae]